MNLSNNHKEMTMNKSNWSFVKILGTFIFVMLFGNVSFAQCDDIMACNDLVNVSLGDNCQETIVANMILEGQLYPNDNYVVQVTTQSGVPIPNNIMNRNHLKKTYKVNVTLNGCDLSCWGNIYIEDKSPPVITNCADVTINCGQSTTPGGVVPRPSATDPCTSATLKYTDKEKVSQCTDPYVKVITRTWIATDADGNTSSCTQTINVVRPTIDNVDFPSNYDGNEKPVILCQEVINKLPNGAPHPDYSGYPTGIGCANMMYFYEDLIFDICGASKKVLRQWTVIDWCTGRDTVGVQVIKIVDNAPPICSSPNDYKYNVTTDPGKCTATFKVPAPNVTYECSQWDYIVGYKLRDASGSPYVNPSYDKVKKTTNADGTYYYTISDLPCDTSWLVYTITDKCGNSTQCFAEVIAKDGEEPTPVCEGYTIVSLEDNGWGDVYATSIDDGSSDNCAISKFEVKRLENNCGIPGDLNFSKKVNFCCADVKSDPNFYYKVVLRVYDKGGNYADCIGNVKVQDKKKPTITDVPDITIDCEVTPDTSRTGVPIGYDNCGVKLTYSDNPPYNTLKCGLGTITRTWTATDPQGNTATSSQTITIRDSRPFSPNDITWPIDLELNGCSKDDAHPDLIQSRPTYVNSNCADIAISWNDTLYTVQGVCLKIIRTWRVVNWCDVNPQNPTYFIRKQKITLKNSTPPVFVTGCSNKVITSPNSDCEEYVEHAVTATDDCTSPIALRYTWEYDEDNNGTINATGNGSFVAKVYPAGTHKMTFKVKDLCENIATCSYTFEIRDNKPPTPICHPQVTWVLDEQGKATVWASDFDFKSEDFCDGDNLHFSFSTNESQTSRTFTCADVPNGREATIPLKMYVFDTDGNSEYCDVKLILQDSPSKNVCPNTNLTATINGKVINKQSVGFESIDVSVENMDDHSKVSSTTKEEGIYSIAEVPAHKDYLVAPKKNDDLMNGISTLDIVMIQRHILGSKVIDNPYDILAGDVNKDKRISASDIVALRKLVLGTSNSFPNNDGWRFVPANYTFADPHQPFDVPQGITINSMDDDINNLDFIAIKVGDINNSASYSFRSNNAEPRNGNTILYTANMMAQQGDLINVPIKIENLDSYAGGQLQFLIDENQLEWVGIESGVADIKEDHFTFNNGVLKISTSSINGQTIANGDVLFTLTFKAINAGQIGNALMISESDFTTEIYDNQLEQHKVIFETRGGDQESVAPLMNFPNPFSDATTIEFNTVGESQAKLSVYDLSGKVIYNSFTYTHKGLNKMVVSKTNLNSKTGVYMFKLETDGYVKSGKMILID